MLYIVYLFFAQANKPVNLDNRMYYFYYLYMITTL